MFKEERQDLIKQISEKRSKSLVICYVLGDRQPFATNIADDVIPILQRHLKDTSPTRISFFIYTRGGDMIAPLRIVKLLRSYCSELEILIPYNAHSAGTLLALGVDRIVMGRLAELSPIDPTIGHPFNPESPKDPKQKLPISVEDINSYFLFAKEKAGVKKDKISEIYGFLVNNSQAERSIHPLTIGSSYRSYRMAKMLAEKLLKLHTKGLFVNKKVKRIVDELTGKISIHNYPITRDEALKLGLKVEYATDVLEKDMWQLYQQYAKEIRIGVPFNPVEFLGDKTTNTFTYSGAYIESVEKLDEFSFKGVVKKEEKDGKINIGMNILASQWQKIK